ncbi:MAG: acyltransferase [Gammaproteobacteria bacterium]|nr:acyltransferase [Gammaproteobacteria bacterium]
MNESAAGFLRAILGETRETFHLQSADAARDLTVRMVEQATRTLDLISRDLEPHIFDQQPFIEALKRLALKSRIARIRILLQDNNLIRQQGHRLVDLAQRLTSTIEIRRPDEEYREFDENFLLVDGSGYLHRQLADRYEVTACFNNRLQTTQLEALFTEIWERGEPDREMLRLHL